MGLAWNNVMPVLVLQADAWICQISCINGYEGLLVLQSLPRLNPQLIDFRPLTKDLKTILYFTKKHSLSQGFFQKYPLFYQFSQWVRCGIFQIKTDFLISQRNINIFTQEILSPSSISRKLSIANFFRNIHFLPHSHCL